MVIPFSLGGPNEANATHTTFAIPPGGIYTQPISILLESSDTSAAIYFTLDGSDPSTNSTEYDGSAIDLNGNSTLKFLSIVENHTSGILTENYSFIPPPVVVTTEPQDNDRRVDIFLVINATFNRAMDEGTINGNSFLLMDEDFESSISGTVTYDSLTNTASFIPDPFSIISGHDYNVTLTSDVKDALGNPLENTTWTFTTGGQIMIFVQDVETFTNIDGSAFTITPNPFTLEGSLEVTDNGEFDSDLLVFGSRSDGILVVNNVDNSFTTYLISETTLPAGYSVIYTDSIVTVVEVDACGEIFCLGAGVFLENIKSTSVLSEIGRPVTVPAPYLDSSQFALFKDKVTIGKFSGIRDVPPVPTLGNITDPNSASLPTGAIVTPSDLDSVDPDSFNFPLNFGVTAPAGTAAQDLFENFEIPTYPGVEDSILVEDVIYVMPPIVIPYADSKNNFVLTPIIDHVFPGLNILIKQRSLVEGEVARVDSLNMTLNVEADNVGFSFGVSDTAPPGTPDPPLDASALFLDIGFVGDADFSDPAAFRSSPRIDILVNKTLPGFPELPNGCPDFRLLFFNGDDWEEIQKLNPTGNFSDFCPFTLEPEHFSKFAVGGVKGQTIQTEQEQDSSGGSGGGGRSRSTAITQTPSGSDVETSINTESGIVLIHFESVEDGSGQIKINSNELSVFEEFFDTLAILSQDDDEHGMARIDGSVYATAGDVFDIDASAVMFSGKLDVTIPYDEETVVQFGPESTVKFIHFNEELSVWEDVTGSVDENANTVTGTLESLSPVAAAIIIEGGSIEVDTTYVQVRSPEFTVSSGTVSMSAKLKNMYLGSQEYVMIVQIVDEQGIAQHIDWHTGTLDRSQETDIGMNWQDLADGTYRVKVIVLTDLDEPWFLSEPVSEQFDVRQPS